MNGKNQLVTIKLLGDLIKSEELLETPFNFEVKRTFFHPEGRTGVLHPRNYVGIAEVLSYVKELIELPQNEVAHRYIGHHYLVVITKDKKEQIQVNLI